MALGELEDQQTRKRRRVRCENGIEAMKHLTKEEYVKANEKLEVILNGSEAKNCSIRS